MTELPEYILFCPNLEDAQAACILLTDETISFSFRPLMNGTFEIMQFGYMDHKTREHLKKYGKTMEIRIFGA